MFKFFPDENDAGKAEGDDALKDISFAPCKEILISDFHSSLLATLTNRSKPAVTTVSVWKGNGLKCVNLSELSGVDEVFKKEGNEKVKSILQSATDLVSGEYEGGFKTWECTFDLITYLHDNSEDIFRKDRSLRVLDMGCGSGLVGLAVLRLAETMGVEITVDFQDYNSEVINYVTVPNTLLNFKDEMASRCKFFSGDWDSFRDVVGCDSGVKSSSNDDSMIKKPYDLILSSETIYNVDYFPKFLRVIKSCLRSDGGGFLYLAAKTCYFGVGGGTKAFLNMINEDDALEGSVVHVIKHGIQREIIRCRYISPAN